MWFGNWISIVNPLLQIHRTIHRRIEVRFFQAYTLDFRISLHRMIIQRLSLCPQVQHAGHGANCRIINHRGNTFHIVLICPLINECLTVGKRFTEAGSDNQMVLYAFDRTFTA